MNLTIEHYTSIALALIAALGTVAGVAIPQYFKIKRQIEDLKARDQEQRVAINANTALLLPNEPKPLTVDPPKV